MSHLSKILLRILTTRIRKQIHPEIFATQFGFVPDRSTRNAILSLSNIIERSIEVQTDVYLCFIDYAKAFDKVRHSDVFKMLSNLNIDGKDLTLLKNLCGE